MPSLEDLHADPILADVSLSGGGHRATLWAYGTLYGLVRARLHESDAAPRLRIASVASVSGGSIANGVMAHDIDDLNAVDESGFAEAIRDSVRNIIDDGLIPGSATTRYLRTLTMAAGLALSSSLVLGGAMTSAGRDWGVRAFIVPVVALVMAALLFGVWRAVRGGVVPLQRLLMQTGLAAVAGVLLGLGVWLGTALEGWQATRVLLLVGLISGLLWWIALGLFAARGRVVENALERLFFSVDGKATKLSDLGNRTVHHVFCATELQSGDHVYLTPKLLNGYLLGETARPSMSVAQAVQASASLPGAFPPQETELVPNVELVRPWPVTGGLPKTPVRRVVLADGGVYDNMGEQWSAGFERRAGRSALVRDSQAAAHFMVVSNSGKALGWRGMLPTNTVLREMRGLMRDQQIQYDATTSQRRRAVVARFRAGEASGEGPIGAIIHMGTSPFEICQAFVNSPNAARAARALQVQSALGSAGRWDEVVSRNATVGTVLSTLKPDTALDLVEHASILTLTALYVVHGIGAANFPTRDELRDLFELA